jgi:hypothetical protein
MSATVPPPASRVRTYSMVLPAPWRRISLRGDLRGQVERLVDKVVAQTPPQISPDEVAPKRHWLERQLLDQAVEAQRNGGVDLFLPVEDWHGFLISASIVVSEVVPDATAGADSVGPVMADLLRDADTRPETVGDTVFVRSETVREARPDGPASPSRHVRYVTAVPGDERTWLMAQFACVGDDVEGDDETSTDRLLVELFDAIMSTFRWVWDTPDTGHAEDHHHDTDHDETGDARHG